MERVTIREGTFAAIREALQDAMGGDPVDRNRRSQIRKSESLPRLVLQDGPQDPLSDDSATGEGATFYGRLEGYAYSPPQDDGAVAEAQASKATNELHALACQALFRPNDRYPEPITVGGMELYLRPGSMDFDLVPTVQGADDIAAFYLEFSFDLRFAHGSPFLPQP